MLERIKQIIGISDDSKDALLTELMSNTSQSLLLLVGSYMVPKQLEFIVIEVTVARYNRIGSEGSTTEQIEGVLYTYSGDLFEPYMAYINAYIRQNETSSNGSNRLKML